MAEKLLFSKVFIFHAVFYLPAGMYYEGGRKTWIVNRCIQAIIAVPQSKINFSPGVTLPDWIYRRLHHLGSNTPHLPQSRSTNSMMIWIYGNRFLLKYGPLINFVTFLALVLCRQKFLRDSAWLRMLKRTFLSMATPGVLNRMALGLPYRSKRNYTGWICSGFKEHHKMIQRIVSLLW